MGTDTRIILYCLPVSQAAPTTTLIIVRSRETDVLILLRMFSCCESARISQSIIGFVKPTDHRLIIDL